MAFIISLMMYPSIDELDAPADIFEIIMIVRHHNDRLSLVVKSYQKIHNIVAGR